MVFFRSQSVGEAILILKNSTRLGNIGIIMTDDIYSMGLSSFECNILLISIIALFICSYMREKKIAVQEWILQQNPLFRYLLYWIAMVLILISVDMSGAEFIYFQF